MGESEPPGRETPPGPLDAEAAEPTGAPPGRDAATPEGSQTALDAYATPAPAAPPSQQPPTSAPAFDVLTALQVAGVLLTPRPGAKPWTEWSMGAKVLSVVVIGGVVYLVWRTWQDRRASERKAAPTRQEEKRMVEESGTSFPAAWYQLNSPVLQGRRRRPLAEFPGWPREVFL